MKTATGAMIALLGPNGSRALYRAHCYDITLLDGTLLRLTSWGSNLVFNGNTYLGAPQLVENSAVTQTVGTAVGTMTLSLTDDGSAPTIEGLTLIQAVRAGLFAKATVKMYKIYMATPGDTTPGGIIWFYGRISTVDKLSRLRADMTVASMLEVLQNKVPRRIIQPSCSNTLFDGGCRLVRASFKISSVVVAGSTQNKIITSLGNPDGYFTQGVIEFTSGANINAKRSIRLHLAGQLTLSTKLTGVVTAGDTFDVYPGCDKLSATCNTKFSNLINFQGEPFVPVPETAI